MAALAESWKELRISVVTWNVAQTDPLDNKGLEVLLHSNDTTDILAIGLQEIKTGALRTVDSFINYDEWTEKLASYLSRRNFYLVENVRVQGLCLCLFASLSHLPFIRFIHTEIERTGVASAWGDKGGVALSCSIYGQQVCFLNVHLEAHLKNEQDRIEDANEIFEEIRFKNKTTVLGHSLVLMFGDMNFRLDDLPREYIIEAIKKKNYSVLLGKDQLIKLRRSQKILSQFEEITPDFDPTYKFDPGTDIYDTSEKKRKPAWTDRVMWRYQDMIGKNDAARMLTFHAVDQSYTSVTSLKQSDHRPVTCEFILKVRLKSSAEPLIHIETVGDWSPRHDGRFTIEPSDDMEWNSKDYIGLYQGDFRDFRSYKAYIYVPESDTSSSSSSDSSLEDWKSKQEHIPGSLRVQHLKFKKSQIKEVGSYKLGYYSHIMSCLVALSSPFIIQ